MTTQQQGEVYIRRIDALPADAKPFAATAGLYIVSHSETGHHHVLDAKHCEVLEAARAPAGMAILYAIVREPTALTQTAPDPHDAATLAAGIYEMRISREFDPFAEQARRVAD